MNVTKIVVGIDGSPRQARVFRVGRARRGIKTLGCNMSIVCGADFSTNCAEALVPVTASGTRHHERIAARKCAEGAALIEIA